MKRCCSRIKGDRPRTREHGCDCAGRCGAGCRAAGVLGALALAMFAAGVGAIEIGRAHV